MHEANPVVNEELSEQDQQLTTQAEEQHTLEKEFPLDQGQTTEETSGKHKDVVDTDQMSEEEIDDLFADEEETMTKEELEDDFPKMDIRDVKPIEYETRSAVDGKGNASDVRIINTKRHGRRIVLKADVIQQLKLKNTIQAGLIDDTLILAKNSISKNTSYNLRKQGLTFVVYNTKLIQDITQALKLDFAEVTSINLNCKYVTQEDVIYLMCKK